MRTSENDQPAHFCLFVRDANGLKLSGLEAPPLLSDAVGYRDSVSHANVGEDLSESWTHWWRRIVRVRGRLDLDYAEQKMSPQARIEVHLAAVNSVCDPLEGFHSLREFPELRTAAQRCWDPFYEWSRTHRSGRRPRSASPERDAVERMINEYGVSPDLLKIGVLPLLVADRWSHIPEPGLLLCSEKLYFDDAFYEAELRRAFESCLDAGGT